jgi:large-conductance mechanosensitive channel
MLLLFVQQVSDMPDTGIVDAKNLIQINATMIAGVLIFYTIPYISGRAVWKKDNLSEKLVLASIAIAIGLFASSSILAFIVIIPYLSYLLTIFGFVAITTAAGIFIKLIQMSKAEIKQEKEEEEEEKVAYPQPWTDKMQDEIREEEVKRKQEEELQKKTVKMEESKSFISYWPDQPKESSDKSPIDDAVGEDGD